MVSVMAEQAAAVLGQQLLALLVETARPILAAAAADAETVEREDLVAPVSSLSHILHKNSQIIK
jgi:hypothetical protein